jgi:hypothetical protein
MYYWPQKIPGIHQFVPALCDHVSKLQSLIDGQVWSFTSTIGKPGRCESQKVKGTDSLCSPKTRGSQHEVSLLWTMQALLPLTHWTPSRGSVSLCIVKVWKILDVSLQADNRIKRVVGELNVKKMFSPRVLPKLISLHCRFWILYKTRERGLWAVGWWHGTGPFPYIGTSFIP